ncbi:uncharacterized protein C8A04DRAFT_25752 [Dichotomopilus funicola]|uniref:Survival Motor Neuron Gemin2-binding domain-containing protein n=1 Tax=Dichotomopilus funicola TaxID=1934379 RepID=A0AAN6ZP48_9PEZI|nr:hypothetical protein C8A04DRAFT_25752 [Dichotomopilus funicola]
MDSETAATHEEIWDDSALINSWNQALEEYKKYHSIHAKGGTVDDIPDDGAQRVNAKPETDGKTVGEGQEEEEEEEGELDETMLTGSSDETSHPANEVQAGASAPMSGPQMLLGNIQDEELKKLLMSWYYAGYYTGLFEGKQQGNQQAKGERKDY